MAPYLHCSLAPRGALPRCLKTSDLNFWKTPCLWQNVQHIPCKKCTISALQVGDQIVEINGEATQGITHTRAIELIQAGGSKVHLLLRPGQGLVPDHSEWQLPAACMHTHCCHKINTIAYTYFEAFVWICLIAGCWVSLFSCMCCELLSLDLSLLSFSLLVLFICSCFLHWHGRLFLPIYLFLL